MRKVLLLFTASLTIALAFPGRESVENEIPVAGSRRTLQRKQQPKRTKKSPQRSPLQMTPKRQPKRTPPKRTTPQRKQPDARTRPKEKPNLIFILTDQQRFDALSYNGINKVLRTPNINRIAREGVWFRNAYTSAPVCGPARTSLFTGKTIENTGVRKNNFPGRPGLKSYDEYLVRNEGYLAEYYGKWHIPNFMARTYQNRANIDLRTFNLFAPYRQFLERQGYQIPARPRNRLVTDTLSKQLYTPNRVDTRWRNRDFSGRLCECDQYGVSELPPQHTLTAMEIRRSITAMRRLVMNNKTFSIHLSLNNPHAPHTPSRPFAKLYQSRNMPVPPSINDTLKDSPYQRFKRRPVFSDPNLVGDMIKVYYAQVKEVDFFLGKLLDEMDRLGLTNNTMVIFTSDHGEMLGNHGMIEKNTLYEEAVHVPLLMRFPREIAAGTIVSTPVSHRDVFATILDYLGAQKQSSDGASLRPLIEGRVPSGVEYVVSENAKIEELMIRAGPWKLIIPNKANSTTVNALYNLRRDPFEIENLIGPSNPSRRRSLGTARNLRNLLVQWCRKVRSPHLRDVRLRKL